MKTKKSINRMDEALKDVRPHFSQTRRHRGLICLKMFNHKPRRLTKMEELGILAEAHAIRTRESSRFHSIADI